MKKIFLTLLSVLTAFVAFAQTSIKVEAPNVVATDEQFNLTFIIEGENSPSDFEWTSGADFQIQWGPQQGKSTSIQIIQGQRSKTVQNTYTYVLRPVKAGRFTIPSATAKVRGKTISSETKVVEVVAAGASSNQSGARQSVSQPITRQQTASVQDSDIFLSLNLDRTDVVVGEPIIATLKLYQRVNIAGFENVSFPNFNGFWSQEIESPTNIEFAREVYDGQIYNAALLRKFVLVPQQQGKVTISPAELTCLVNIRVSNGGTSIFDGFFDDYRTVRKKVATQPFTVTVNPLPSGAPSSFAGGVGQFNISAKVNKDTLKTHEAASLVLTVSGRGNITLLETPKVNFPLDMEVYDTKISDKIDKSGLSGSRTYEYPFIPRSYGDFEIEPIRYSFYDVNQQKYVTLETQPILLTVLKGNDSDVSGGAAVSGLHPKDVKNLASDIRFINVKDSELIPQGQFFVGSVLFWIFTIALLVLAVIAWAALRHLAARRADVVGTKNRKATKMALKRLQLANTLLKQNLYTAFYEELHKALLGFISDKLNMPSSELSRERITSALTAGGVAPSVIETFISILDACEFARYSPATGNDAMAAHYASALEVISSIDSDMKTHKNASKAVLPLILMLLLPFAADASNDAYVDSLWNTANQSYMEGRWADAVSCYEKISRMGMESAALYCNTGDAYFKDGNVPMAILFYERALKLDPSYEDARYNLELLNSTIQDRIDPVPDFILKVWAKDICYLMNSDAWALCFLVLLAVTLALVLLFILGSTAAGRRTGFFTGMVSLLLAVSCLCFSLWQKNDYMSADSAIVMRPVTSVKSSPSSEASTDLFILHEGTKVRILDTVGKWNNIELVDGRQGWILSKDIEII